MASELAIIDVDPGLDDSRALIYALNDSKYTILAIMSCNGNVNSQKAALNAGLVTTACNQNFIPIYQGVEGSLNGRIYNGDGYYGPDGMGNLKPFNNKHLIQSDVSAHRAIVTLSRAYPNKITLIMCGPLTNLARAFYCDNEIVKIFQKIYILGGDRSEFTIRNHSPFSEFNANRDPEAFDIVLKHFGKENLSPLFILDWTFCGNYSVKKKFMKKIAAKIRENTSRKHEADILDAEVERRINNNEEEDTLYLADELLMVCGYNSEIITKLHRVILNKIDLEDDDVRGLHRGKTYFQDDEKSNTFLIDEIDFNKWKDIFRKTIIQGIAIT